MSETYYLQKDTCRTCHRPEEILTIGVSSYGWKFALVMHPEKGIYDLGDWIPWLLTGKIVDEINRPVSVEVMLSKITRRNIKKDPLGESNEKKYEMIDPRKERNYD